MSLYHETANKTLIAVSESPRQDLAAFKYNTIPTVKVDGATSDINATIYRLPKLINSLRNDGTFKFEPGGTIPPKLHLNSVAATVTPEGEQTHRIDRDLVLKSKMTDAAFQKSRFADLNNATPILMGLAGQKINRDFLSALTSTTLFGALKTFNGTGKLADLSPDHEPLTDIETELEALRQYKSFTNFELVCKVSSEVLRVMAKQNEYTGWAQAGGMPRALSVPQIAQLIKEIHGCDRIEICDSIDVDGVQATTDPSIQWQKKELLHFGLYDKKKAYDLTGAIDFMAQGPDGALACGWAREPVLVRWDDKGRETESFTVRWSKHFYSPRGDSSPLAINFGDIFTAI